MATSALLRDGTILNDRYRIVKQVGRGGFGRTYLAEDTHRYRELCILKEFAPQVESDRDARKAEELFEREAGILYQLKHDQIPDFEALLRTRIDGKQALFLVQEYIEGDTYWDLLQREKKLTETEVTTMICELLPVLEYIHENDLIHRDISPDNLIKREFDSKPVLIDFGCVKLAANAVSKSTGQSLTLIGKKGYSPDEQLRQGQAFPSSDLYSLAATAVVLLTGKKPDELYDSHQGEWHWQLEVKVNATLNKVLNKMLAYRPRDRYQSAREVLQVLALDNSSFINSFISRIRTLVVAPRDEDRDGSGYPVSQVVSRVNSNISRITTRAVSVSRHVTRIPSVEELKRVKPWHWGLIISGVLLLPGILSFTVVQNKFASLDRGEIESNSSLNKKELKEQQDIYNRIQKLKLDSSIFYRQVDDVFHEEYPELKGTRLTDAKEDQKYRQVWYKIANNLLKKLENK
ncbi:MAG: hypothetical protein Tsb0014_01520 [Pleurocapsa sp.]